jgi:hypothetical protein
MSTEFSAYFDDSGHPDDQDVVLVAGWAGTVEQWALWEEGWNKILKDYGIKSGIFHMTDFEAAANSKDPNNEYHHLGLHERRRLLARLINQTTTRTRHMFSTMVPMLDYKEVNELYHLEEWIGKPYTIASIAVLQRLTAWKDKFAPHDPLVVFFEDGTKHKGDLIKVCEQFGFDIPIFKKKKDVTPLQAADLFAWESFNVFKTGIVRSSLLQIQASGVPQHHGSMTLRCLLRACEDMEVPRRDPAKPRAFSYTSSPKVPRLRQISSPPREGQIKGSQRIGLNDLSRVLPLYYGSYDEEGV